MRYVFMIQGEGRGHITQAIALLQLLTDNGHEVASVFIGTSPERELPAFFKDKFQMPLHTYDSPNFRRDHKNKGIKLVWSFVVNLLKTGTYFSNLKMINKLIKQYNPDVFINFYDIMGGLLYLIYNPAPRYVVIAHHFMAMHHEFTFPKRHPLGKIMLKALNRVTAFRSDKIIALSFAENNHIQKIKLFVVPPLIRQEILDAKIEKRRHILGYILNHGYSEDIIKGHREVSGMETHVFWDNFAVDPIYKVNGTLYFHHLDEKSYIKLLRTSNAFFSTAGFESVCEALFLQKPVMVVPVKNHYEQLCNAIDAEKTGGVLHLKEFNLNELLRFSNQISIDYVHYRKWIIEGRKLFLESLTNF